MHWYGKKGPPAESALDLGLTAPVHRLAVFRPAEMAGVLEKIEGWMKVLDYPPRDVFAVLLTIHEAASNAFRHGHRGDCSKPVRISYLVREDEVLIRVEDQGPGFDPELVPESCWPENVDRPGGRGLKLMRAYAHWIFFAPPGNRVTFSRRRSQ
jgi:serine/threonine-protein kinase RsbW